MWWLIVTLLKLAAILFGIFVVFMILIIISEKIKTRNMTPEELDVYQQKLQETANSHREVAKSLEVSEGSFSLVMARGARNKQIFCPHCQVTGKVHTKVGKHRAGISGGKAAAGLLTAGTSLIVTGVSRREMRTAAYCDNCKSEWMF